MAPKTYTIDLALDQIGYGRFQTLSVWTFAIIRAGGFASAIFAFLIYEQRFLCMDVDGTVTRECSAEEICAAREAGSDMEYKVDESYEYYLNNWYLQMDLTCTSESVILSLLSWSSIGCLASIIFATLLDKIGRKKTMFFG